MDILATGNKKIKWPTDHSLPIDATFNVYISDLGGTTVNFTTPVNPAPLPAWPTDYIGKKAGYGLGLYGIGKYGRGVRGFGYGKGPYGMGLYGKGAAWLPHVLRNLTDGTYVVSVVPRDPAGNEDHVNAKTQTITLASKPAAPASVTASADGDNVKLTWPASTDEAA